MNAAAKRMDAVPENRELEYVDPHKLGTVWGPVVRPVLEKYVNDWAPEDAYSEIKAGRSHLFLGRGGDDGFVIVSTAADWRGSVFWIWFAYGEGVGKLYWPQLVRMAKDAGCDRMAFSSRLHFWKSYCETYGFCASRTIYELEI